MFAEDFKERLCTEDFSKRIFITPMLDEEKQIGEGIIDLRLGTEFILTRKTEFSFLDLSKDDKEIENDIKLYQSIIRIEFGKRIFLHPNQFILGCTLEYIKIPNDFFAYIIGRSSWGRLGLIIATATLINPGFAGVITLELTNLGEVPIDLYPGMRIAQIAFHQCSFNPQKIEKKSRYFGSVCPYYSRIYEEEDRKWIVQKEK